MGLSGFEPESQGPKPRRLAKLPHNPVLLEEPHSIFKYYGKIYKEYCLYHAVIGVVKMAKKQEKYDVDDIIVIEDKKKKDDEFDLGKDDVDAGFDDDELDFDDMDFDDGGD